MLGVAGFQLSTVFWSPVVKRNAGADDFYLFSTAEEQ